MLRTKWPLPQEVASKLEKVKVIKKIPVVKETRIVDLVAKFGDFPWAQGTTSLGLRAP